VAFQILGASQRVHMCFRGHHCHRAGRRNVTQGLVVVPAKTELVDPSSPWPQGGYGSGARGARVWKLQR
jgi:hypothetical protein